MEYWKRNCNIKFDQKQLNKTACWSRHRIIRSNKVKKLKWFDHKQPRWPKKMQKQDSTRKRKSKLKLSYRKHIEIVMNSRGLEITDYEGIQGDDGIQMSANKLHKKIVKTDG